MSIGAFAKRTAVLLTVTLGTSMGVVVGTAAADVETVCNAYYCNSTKGKNGTIERVDALRGELILGTKGFFEVFLPDGTKRTGPTNTERNHLFYINKTFKSGLICLRYFELIKPGKPPVFQEQGKATCTSIPID
ncbi:hypothetical protein [Amycolatopsis decaplanina]|uniref:Uncharacterized protein n=1 Tax=Amycolatopsis decaplanina DSM 44594 TaxID=1284240 RepID=M2ZQY7_9PSEU|nr:hypothetical protein [Amycolatopsis decaplanina]EME62759.1 hypothetical protein H074_07606 [Amycolatopsis decaplanina DSM 44594]